MSAVVWLLEHPTLTLTVCALLVVQALTVLLVRGGVGRRVRRG
jgi:hypothetical protein